jgi:hypothetical protein
VRDGSQPIGRRRAALGSCANATPVGYHAVLDAVRAEVGARDKHWDDAQLREAIDVLEGWRAEWRAIDLRWRELATERKRSRRPLTDDDRAQLDRERRAVGPGFPRTRLSFEERQRTLPRHDSFPAHLADDLAVVRSILAPPIDAATRTFEVLLDDWVTIAKRESYAEPQPAVLASLTPRQVLMLHCLFTRHHDGYVRQRHLAPLLVARHHWVIPYVVQLLGEYVVEIIEEIRDGTADVHVPGSWQHDRFRSFAVSNGSFVALTRQRAASYWTCYYRDEYLGPGPRARNGTRHLRPERYPAFDVLDAMAPWFAPRP